ncbi:MAG: hypothetical protein F4244_10715 [Gammaproteobacteria bacterium]|nr:hypothetical protein [Gammaproteobacteria bacterium]
MRNEISPGRACRSDRDMEKAIRMIAASGHHPACTCRMGSDDDPDAVLDAELKVRGIEGLRVVDGSSLPDQVSGNLNAPIMMIAEKAADIILNRTPLPPEYPT